MEEKIIEIMGTQTKFYGNNSDTYFANLNNNAFHNQTLVRVLTNLQPSSVMLDIGGNIGITAAIGARTLTSGRVIVVEPSKLAAQSLQMMITNNQFNNITLLNCAAGSEVAELCFNETDFLAGSYISSEYESNTKVMTYPIDYIVGMLGLNCLDVVKIDVEGFELDVMHGINQTLLKFNPYFVMEFNSFALSCNRSISPFSLGEYILNNFSKFIYYKGDEMATVDSIQSLREFVYFNMATGCVNDIIFRK